MTFQFSLPLDPHSAQNQSLVGVFIPHHPSTMQAVGWWSGFGVIPYSCGGVAVCILSGGSAPHLHSRGPLPHAQIETGLGVAPHSLICGPPPPQTPPPRTDKQRSGPRGAAPHPLVRGPLQLSKFRCILAILGWLGSAEPSFLGTIILGCVLWFHGCRGFAEPRPHVFPISPLRGHSRTLMMAPLVLCHWYFEARGRDFRLIGLCRAQLSEKSYFWGVYYGFLVVQAL